MAGSENRRALRITVLTTVAGFLVLLGATALADVGDLTLASTSDAGAKGNANSGYLSLSASGVEVAFDSASTNLDSADSDTLSDVYVKNLTTGALILASTSDSGVKGNNHSFFVRLSDDASRLVFISYATNLDPADTDAIADVYVKDLVTGDVMLASTSDTGMKSNSDSGYASLSADGTRVSFQSSATNLDPADTDSLYDVYVKDLVTGDITLASTSDSGVKGNNNSTSFNLSLSADGARVAFYSDASNLDAADSDAISDIYVKDLTTGDLILASTSIAGVKGNSYSIFVVLSPDGTRVAFTSGANNLDPMDTDTIEDVYVKDLASGELHLASTSDAGIKGNGTSIATDLSNDGARVAFFSYATNIDAGDMDSNADAYVKDLTSGATALASTSDSNVKGNGLSATGSISADGTVVGFESEATNLNPIDADTLRDVYVKQLGQISEAADLAVTKNDNRDPIGVGDRFAYLVTVKNHGPSEATAVMVTDLLPMQSRFISAKPTQGGCHRVGRELTCNLGSLSAGGTARLRIVVQATRSTVLRNTVDVRATVFDPNPVNNKDIETTRVR
jgi:uncharacterized repeat protein (TIGR01451 family)